MEGATILPRHLLSGKCSLRRGCVAQFRPPCKENKKSLDLYQIEALFEVTPGGFEPPLLE